MDSAPTAYGRLLRIGMIDVDLLNNGTRHPNLAQMKMSSYCKSRGHDVRLIYAEDELENLKDYDYLLVSKVFDFTPVPPQLDNMIKNTGKTLEELNRIVLSEEMTYCETHPREDTRIHIGGTGFFADGGRDLEDRIEHIMPDYDLYLEYVETKIGEGRKRSYFSDYLDTSIGFLSRGCFRKCSFCVNRRYDRAEICNEDVRSFLKPGSKRILLWDDNFLALGKRCLPLLDMLIRTGIRFQFRQGLDIRLMTHETAEKFMQCKYYGDYIFAFDHIQDKELIQEKLSIWREHCNKETKLYVLCAYDPHCVTDPKHYISEGETVEEKDYIDICNTFERIRILMRYQCLPYIMRYRDHVDSKYRGMYIQLARWCNQPSLFKKMTFLEYIDLNLRLVKGDDCAPAKALRLFLKDHPEFPPEYLNMRYSDYAVKNDAVPIKDRLPSGTCC